jgi:histidinol-phosphate aminotransferase
VNEQPHLIHLNLNENAFGASPSVAKAIQAELSLIARYGTTAAVQAFAERIAERERVAKEQIVFGEVLGALGLHFGSEGGPGGEFLYSTPGYLALINAAFHVGGVAVPVPLDSEHRNDLPALAANVNAKTRAVYLINPHNPSGTTNDNAQFKHFLRDVSQRTPVVVDEAYLEYTVDFESRSAVSLVRDGANVIVFRTFDKIHGLAGLPMGYAIVPTELGNILRKQGVGDAESLGRLNVVAASAAFGDVVHVEKMRTAIASERLKWIAVLESLKLPHSKAEASFLFFDTGHPQQTIADAMHNRGVDIGRPFPPAVTWARITIGLPEENKTAQEQLRHVLATL